MPRLVGVGYFVNYLEEATGWSTANKNTRPPPAQPETTRPPNNAGDDAPRSQHSYFSDSTHISFSPPAVLGSLPMREARQQGLGWHRQRSPGSHEEGGSDSFFNSYDMSISDSGTDYTRFTPESVSTEPMWRDPTHASDDDELKPSVDEERTEGKESRKGSRVSMAALQEMRRLAASENRESIWLRVVHSGYGQESWRAAVSSEGLTMIAARSPAEGVYVCIPPGQAEEDVVSKLIELNHSVRRKTRFKDMNRANKSRLQFKSAPFVVSPWSVTRPTLVPQTRLVDVTSGDSNYRDGETLISV